MNVLNGLDLHIQSTANSQTDGSDDTVVCFIKQHSQLYVKFEDIFDYEKTHNDFLEFIYKRHNFESKYPCAKYTRNTEKNIKEQLKEYMEEYFLTKTISAKEIAETVCNN